MQSKHRHTEKGTAYSNTRLYKVWCSMKGRCNTPSHTAYKNYGARGITVCKEWAEDFGAFMDWAMQTGYDNYGNFRSRNPALEEKGRIVA